MAQPSPDSEAGEATGRPIVIVSVGMPVYNGADTIGDAISAVLGQTFDDFELIISDNGSTDDTLRICEAAASHDPRIRIIRHEQNRGISANFSTVLAAARGRLFMFAAADDRIEPGFIAETLARLERNPAAVACAPRTIMHFGDGETMEAIGTYPIGGPSLLRPFRFLLLPSDNSRFYGLFRTATMRRAFVQAVDFHALDWVVSALTLVEGEHERSQSVLLHRVGTESETYRQALLSDQPYLSTLLLPLGPMSVALLRHLPPVHRIFALPALAFLNLAHSTRPLRARLRKLITRASA